MVEAVSHGTGEGAEGSREPSRGIRKAGPQAPKILCVDDEPDVLRGLTRVLGTEFRIVTAHDPVAALSLLEKNDDFSVVIADVKMPRMDGGEFLSRAKTLAPMTTRMALTGCVEWDPADSHPSDIFERLTKPCPVDVLHASVAAAVKQHSLLASLPDHLKRLCCSLPAATTSLDDVGINIVNVPSSRPFVDPSVLSGFANVSTAARLGIHLFDRDVELLPGITLLGRSKSCHIVINDPRISRRHACFANNGREVTVENVSATNGVLVNGAPVSGTRRIMLGDRLTLGPLTVDVCAIADYSASLEPTMRFSAFDGGRFDVRTPSSSDGTMPIMMGVAEKALFLGEQKHAERIVRPLLDNVLWRCEDGQCPPREELDAAVNFALRLAEASGTGAWIDYLFKLFSALRAPLPPNVIERLYSLVRNVSGISLVVFRNYLNALRLDHDRMSHAEQFLVRRIQGLEAIILSARG
jgi:CheY-like chemotaxis protein